MLPIIKRLPLQKLVFPKTWQTVIFRNYGFVSTDKIAKTLGCDEAVVVAEATRMGLGEVRYDARWEALGFITIIRNNWYLLPYHQLMMLLDYDETRLEFVLEKEDFLYVKLGTMKPECPEVLYAPLSDEDAEKTAVIAKKVAKYLPHETHPFAFFTEKSTQTHVEKPQSEGDTIRVIHGYLTPCGDAFMQNGEDYLPDSLLQEYQKQGINGVWVHGVLSALSPYPFIPELSKDYKIRRANMQKLVDRANKYGIKVFLYFNEPRGIPEEKLGKYEYLKGTVRYSTQTPGIEGGDEGNGVACLCFEQKEVREYLYEATKDLFTEVKGLGGLITITMSENPTHCHFAAEKNCTCPVCKNIPVEKTVAAVNNTMMQAIKDSGSDGKLLAYLWGWSDGMCFTEEQTKRAIENLDKDIVAVCASEYGVEFEKGGIKSFVIDYSISNPGPSHITKLSFDVAKSRGMTPCAKIQTNNSWECSAVPYLPVYDLVLQHLKNLHEIDVHDYMLTWTLGGYPSPMLGLVAEYSQNPNAFDFKGWYAKQYGAQCELVHQAVQKFCEGFVEYPFYIAGLYNSPKTLGPANLWDLRAEGKRSTMVCFSFDDYETWIQPFPYEIYVSQYDKLFKAWEEGLRLIAQAEETPLIKELKDYAEAAYIHFKADSLQTQFSYYKRDFSTYKTQALDVLREEEEITKRLLVLSAHNPTIGFEASNHYYYNERNLIEKILQTQLLEEELKVL